MKLSLVATNPCHLWDMARELHARKALGRYYSGYPRSRLRGADSIPIACHSGRTLITYFFNRFPPVWRPDMQKVFRWQDTGFDRWTAEALEPCDFIHGMPGQILATFRRAKQLGIRTVLNHATGPLWQQNARLAEEYKRVSLVAPAASRLMKELERQHREEYAVADFHCAASTLVRDQLRAEGIPAERIWAIPYGADQAIFFPPAEKVPAGGRFRIVFAGQLVLRKGLRTLLEALRLVERKDWSLDCYGPFSAETEEDRKNLPSRMKVTFHGAVPGVKLAEAFREASLLVLPSWEEGFGLVVPQALSCGLPCVVSDAVGAKDLIHPRENGSIFAVGQTRALAEEIDWWARESRRVKSPQPWSEPARELLEKSRAERFAV